MILFYFFEKNLRICGSFTPAKPVKSIPKINPYILKTILSFVLLRLSKNVEKVGQVGYICFV